MLSESEYAREKQEIAAALSAPTTPAHAATFEAGNYVSQLGALWGRMETTERWEALQIMLEAVYVNPQTARIVGVRPKPAFRQVSLCALLP